MRQSRAAQLLLAAGAVAVAVYFVLPSVVAKDLVFCVLGFGTTTAILVAVRRRQPVDSGPWYLVATAMLLFSLGTVAFTFYDVMLDSPAPQAAPPDALFLVAYGFLFAGAFRLARIPGQLGTRENLADSIVVCTGAFAALWQLVLGPYVRNATEGELSQLITLIYPLMDLGLLCLLVSTSMQNVRRRTSDRFAVLAVLLLLLGDLINELLVVHPSWPTEGAGEGTFLLAFVVIAVAVSHPSMSDPRPQPPEHPRQSRLWLVGVASAGLCAPVVLLLSGIIHFHVDVSVLAASTILIIVAGAYRASALFDRQQAQTRALRRQQAHLLFQASHDRLTGLANRALLYERVGDALQRRQTSDDTVAVCFCDLDGFKAVNDSMGHRVGDQLLVIIGARLMSAVREDDVVARLGGDEFAILLNNGVHRDEALEIANRVVTALREPMIIDGQRVRLSVSVGLAFAEPDTTSEILLNEADAAMYEAKSHGKDRAAIFECAMRTRLNDRATLINSFPGSLERSEFYLEYQPQVRLDDGQLEGFETLVRWQHPALGTVGPYQFIPLAEEIGLIVALGRWILETACIEAARWPENDGGRLSVSVNVSARQLQEASFFDDVQAALSFSGLDPRQLVLEITETVLVTDAALIVPALRQCREMGIRIAVDDFGTGYSSLSYLRQFPVDILKIDKSFIDPLEDPSSEDIAFVETILRMARDLHLSATAEGVEHPVQRDTLARLSCHSAQGYLMSRPLGRDDAREYIDEAAVLAR